MKGSISWKPTTSGTGMWSCVNIMTMAPSTRTSIRPDTIGTVTSRMPSADIFLRSMIHSMATATTATVTMVAAAIFPTVTPTTDRTSACRWATVGPIVRSGLDSAPVLDTADTARSDMARSVTVHITSVMAEASGPYMSWTGTTVPGGPVCRAARSPLQHPVTGVVALRGIQRWKERAVY